MNPIETPQPLTEKLEKTKLQDEESSDDYSDSSDSLTSEEDDDYESCSIGYSSGGYDHDLSAEDSADADSDNSDSDDSDFLSSEDDVSEPDVDLVARRLRLREQSKQIARDFLQQVQENRFSDFSWPPDPNCPEYDYISHYIGDVVFEEDSEIARRFLDQVKKSWGYQVDCIPPRWMHPALYPVDLKTCFFLTPKQTSECVIDSINAEAKEMGKRFELVRVNKIVGARRELYLLTLTIKDAETNAEKTVCAAVSMPPPCKDPIVVECRLVPSVPA